MRQTLRLDLSLPQAHPARLETLLRGLDAECSEADPGFELASDHFLALILVQLWRQARADLVTHGRAPQGLAERFVLLAGTHFREHWHVEGYAAALGVSRGRLGSAVRRTTGLSPQGYLHRELLREASELLLNTGMPVGQIAFRLGYSDPAYFTRFFTRKTGQSPERFRRARKVQRRTGDASFAAWP